MTRLNRIQNRRGATLTEFAFVAPLLFLLFFAAFEFCRVAMIRHTADNAVYEGCRLAIIPGATSLDAESETRRIMSSLGVTNVRVAVSPTTFGESTEEVTVKIEVPLNENSFVPNHFVAGPAIVRELTMRREGVQ